MANISIAGGLLDNCRNLHGQIIVVPMNLGKGREKVEFRDLVMTIGRVSNTSLLPQSGSVKYAQAISKCIQSPCMRRETKRAEFNQGI